MKLDEKESAGDGNEVEEKDKEGGLKELLEYELGELYELFEYGFDVERAVEDEDVYVEPGLLELPVGLL